MSSRGTSSGTRDRLFLLFVQDGRNMIDSLREIIGSLKGQGFNRDLLNKAFRHAHSIKSESAFLGFEKLSRQAHALEDMLAEMRERGSVPEQDAIQSLQRAIGTLDRLFTRILTESEAHLEVAPGSEADQRAENEGRIDEIDHDGLLRLSRHEQAVLREARTREERLYRFSCDVLELEPMLYARLYLVLSNLEKIVNVVKTFPSLDSIPPGSTSFEAMITTRMEPLEISSAVDVDRIENVVLTELDYQAVLGTPAQDEEGYRSGIMAGLNTVSVKMPIRTYEQLCLYAEELRAEVKQSLDLLRSDPGVPRSAMKRFLLIERFASLVSGSIGESSIVPLHSAFSRVGVFVTKLAGRIEKKVRYHSAGGSHQVYLPMSEVLTEVLTHLARNAVDHGIENPEARVAAGKPEYGELRIDARSDAGRLVIEVTDDGRGVDEAVVRKRFAESGGSSDGMSLLEILAAPGFSTRSKTTDLSGRGVGLDLVRHVVSAVLGGSIALKNNPGRGCRFVITLPAGTSLVSVLVARTGNKEFALPAAEIYETVDLEPRQIQKDENKREYYRYSGEYLPLIRLFPASGAERFGLVLIIQGRRRIVPVDELISEETVIRNPSAREIVYSQTLEHDVPLILPVRVM